MVLRDIDIHRKVLKWCIVGIITIVVIFIVTNKSTINKWYLLYHPINQEEATLSDEFVLFSVILDYEFKLFFEI